MLSGEFERKLRKLNRKLRVFCGDDDGTPAGIHILTPDGWLQVMGCDKNWVGENVEFNENGRMVRSGWRRILRSLIQKRYVDRRTAERVFNTHLPYAARKIKAPVREVKHDLMDRFIAKYMSSEEIKSFEKGRR